ncbi:hypothetical protein V8F63_14180 [Brevundimonas sp. LF-1]|uniref:hypothetical protein n=1 Tax=Brevundimonas sp. LF-1 TaxID=3126100 RepID=UPI0030DFBD3F
MTGELFSFTLRLGPNEIEKALASPRGFVGYFTERMNREFRAAGDPAVQYAFIIETSPVHEPHLHGIISSSLDEVRPVLSRVGGGAKLMKAPERQAHTKRIDRLVGWTRYISKAPFVTSETLNEARRKRGLTDRRDQIIGAPRATRASAKAWYVAQRRSGLLYPQRWTGPAPSRPVFWIERSPNPDSGSKTNDNDTAIRSVS